MLLRLLQRAARAVPALADDRRRPPAGRHVASLYLPSLNADIIDNGVATGDTGYILRTGALMLGVTLRPDRLLDHRRLLRREGRDEPRP